MRGRWAASSEVSDACYLPAAAEAWFGEAMADGAIGALGLGLIARATMNNPGQVAVLGVNPRIVYTVTFAAGAAISGLAGAVLAPVTGVVPTMGAAYIGKAFITVICGGDAIFAGTAIASILFGSINQVTTIVSTAEFGEVALLIGALLMLRILPKGISSLVSNRAV